MYVLYIERVNGTHKSGMAFFFAFGSISTKITSTASHYYTSRKSVYASEASPISFLSRLLTSPPHPDLPLLSPPSRPTSIINQSANIPPLSAELGSCSGLVLLPLATPGPVPTPPTPAPTLIFGGTFELEGTGLSPARSLSSSVRHCSNMLNALPFPPPPPLSFAPLETPGEYPSLLTASIARPNDASRSSSTERRRKGLPRGEEREEEVCRGWWGGPVPGIVPRGAAGCAGGRGEKREDGGGEKSICKFVLGGQWEGDLREGSDFG